MRQTLPLLPLALLAACQPAPRPYAPVDNVRYAALGHDPFWMVTIGDDAIVLTLSPDAGAEDDRLATHRWPRTLPRTVDNVRTWESGGGTEVITVEARPGPCTGSGGRVYENHVTVRLSGRELTGCGGRSLGGGSD